MYLLLKLVHEHPAMREVVSKEVRQLLSRSEMSIRGIYYGVSFLNQIEFTSNDNDLAVSLIMFYFSLFKKYTILTLEGLKSKEKTKISKKKAKKNAKKGKKGANVEKLEGTTETRLKLISALLTGINRALPFGTGTLFSCFSTQ